MRLGAIDTFAFNSLAQGPATPMGLAVPVPDLNPGPQVSQSDILTTRAPARGIALFYALHMKNKPNCIVI